MAIILNIDTATEHASVCLAEESSIIAYEESKEQKNHASFIQPAIDKICKNLKFDLNKIDAVAVSNGPGSYTGLRVSLSTAKGICYALQKPLITLNTLDVIAAAGFTEIKEKYEHQMPFLVCPMIDARRMEVYMALYKSEKELVEDYKAYILTENSFKNYFEKNLIYFLSSGSWKFKQVCNHENARFLSLEISAKSMVSISLNDFREKKFADLAYCEPYYLKEFYTIQK